jgi:hypothetical protein
MFANHSRDCITRRAVVASIGYFLLCCRFCHETAHAAIAISNLNMRFELLPVSKAHKDLASAVSWNIANDLYTCSDDQSMHRWNARGEPQGKVPTRVMVSVARSTASPTCQRTACLACCCCCRCAFWTHASLTCTASPSAARSSRQQGQM